MLERLEGYGHRERCPADTALWTRGQREVDMFVVLDGIVQVYALVEKGERKALATLQPGQFSGELDLLSSRQTLVDGCTVTDCELLRVPRVELQRLMRSEGDIANLIMQATILRRLGILEKGTAGITLLGDSTSADTIVLRRFLTRNGYPHRLIEPSEERFAGCTWTASSQNAERFLPAVIFADGRVLHRPQTFELADALGLSEPLDPHAVYDVTVVGAGPSGLAAAVYAASEGLSTLVVEGIAPGGQAGTSSKIENYLVFPTGVPARSWRTGRRSRRRSSGRRWQSRATSPQSTKWTACTS